MRENRLYGSEGGEAKSLPYPYQTKPQLEIPCVASMRSQRRLGHLFAGPYFLTGHALGLQVTGPRDGETRLCCSRNRSAE
jgi:hypothetical protein